MKKEQDEAREGKGKQNRHERLEERKKEETTGLRLLQSLSSSGVVPFRCFMSDSLLSIRKGQMGNAEKAQNRDKCRKEQC